MTAVRRDGAHQSPFLEWIRSCSELDSRRYNLCLTDSDVWVHRFASRSERAQAGPVPVLEHIQLIEVKTFGAEVPFAQRDTLGVIDAILRKNTVRNGKRIVIKIKDARRPGCYRFIRWLGLHIVILSADRPDTSSRIMWDRHDVNETVLIDLLKFTRDPDHPTRFLDTRRHHTRPHRERLPQMQLETLA